MSRSRSRWLFRRIKQLSQERHGDPFYYFHGHHEMDEPPKVSAYPAKKTIGSTQRKRIFERDEYRCQSCGTWKSLSLDHIIPESRDGTHDDDNLQTLCKPCNSSKGVKTQDEWEASR